MFNLKQITFSKIMLTALAIVMIMSIGLNLRNEIGNWRTKVFNEGKEAGRLEVNQMVVQQLLATGKVGISLPMNEMGQFDASGTLKMIFLAPQISTPQ